MTENAIANGQVALAAIRQHLETLAKKQDELAHLKSSVAFVKANLDKFKGIAAPPVHVDDVLEIQEKARAALWIIDELERLQTENVMASRAGGL